MNSEAAGEEASSRIRAAAQRLEVEEAFYRKLLQMFCERSSSDLATLSAAASRGDRQAGRDAAHSIKGAARNLGLEEISLSATDIEEQMNRDHSDQSQLVERMEELRTAIDGLCAELRREERETVP